MSLKDKLNQVTRRDFLKGVSAVGATAAVYGCGGSGDGGKTYMEEDEENRLTPPAITETTIMGGTPHNCGGRCVSKYYVKDGVVKRITTDEREDKSISEGDNPQYRSCVRCHSRKQWFYRNDRILYPLKQTGERGDVNGFVRISWEQAFTEISAKMQNVIGRYGAKGIHSIYSSGDQTGWARNSLHRLLNILGGYTYYYTDYSFPALEHVAPFVEGKSNYLPSGNSYQDALRSDRVVMWGFNPSEMIQACNASYYLTQIKERGVPFTFVDTRVSKTSALLADEYISIMPCTDAALIMAMLYHLLKNHLTSLDVPFITTYMYGFFDTGNTFVTGRAANAAYTVPDGGSLSAFIMGDDTYLVDQGFNSGLSIYPDSIGYNVNTDDDLYGKAVRIWGQDAKTPEWAEKITGVPAAKIREFAEMYLNERVNTFIGGGYQRHTESEQAIWLHRVLSVVTKNFGAEGRGSGYPVSNTSVSAPSQLLSNSNSVVLTDLYDPSKVTSLDYVPTAQRYNMPVFVIPDAVDNAGTGKSRWNDGQVKAIHEGFGKIIFAPGGNIMVNQSGDVNYNWEIFSDRTKCEMIVTLDHFMTASASISDYILPATMQGEKPGALTSTEGVLRVNKVHDIPGEVMDEYSIMAGIAEKLGVQAQFLDGYPAGQEGMEARLQAGWEAANLTTKYGMTYDEWVEQGIATLHGTYDASSYKITHLAFRNDPVASPLNSASGKFEAFCGNMVEDYEARHHDNIDTSTTDSGGAATLYNLGEIYTAGTGSSTGRRYLYPIPMYIPAVEGKHAVDITNATDEMCHDDPLGLKAKGYTYTLHTWHMMYRSHSTLNNIAYLNECYKQDADGNAAFLDPERDWTEGVWDDGVYESIWMSPSDAVSIGVQTGDRVLISNDRGKMYASVIVTNRVRPTIIHIGQGAWFKKNSSGIDVGGCANTVVTARPSRICKGMTSANDTRVKIEKA
ncbi:twin-arginine translocation signal domain-containing protein [Geovibrio thiophilus]|uniref:Twin-arginine translocation signal domain-containing protein n=1 Tax=Geovibrio thiophilus TaxID=139438 RepID=A0A410JV72_9BACT|nr:molybdopterin-dependent oxidoreductase [Geovibrio thiophilus]QAR32110.1 twin-arginine translocation signal domain-containing protein [Geovibrio thiophilus]